MKRFLQILGVVALGLVVLIALGALFAYSGFYNVAATKGHSKPVEQMLRVVMMRSVIAHARGIKPPADFKPQDRELAEHAAGHFEAMCRTCHGAPGKKPDPWHHYPSAPDLADALRVTRWSDAEVFWMIKNGLKDTGMPAFGPSHDDDDLWALTAFVRQVQTITPEQYREASERAPMKEGAGRENQLHGSESAQPHTHVH